MLPTCHEKFHKSVGLKKIHELLFIIFNYFFYFVAAETFEKSPNLCCVMRHSGDHFPQKSVVI